MDDPKNKSEESASNGKIPIIMIKSYRIQSTNGETEAGVWMGLIPMIILVRRFVRTF